MMRTRGRRSMTYKGILAVGTVALCAAALLAGGLPLAGASLTGNEVDRNVSADDNFQTEPTVAVQPDDPSRVIAATNPIGFTTMPAWISNDFMKQGTAVLRLMPETVVLPERNRDRRRDPGGGHNRRSNPDRGQGGHLLVRRGDEELSRPARLPTRRRPGEVPRGGQPGRGRLHRVPGPDDGDPRGRPLDDRLPGQAPARDRRLAGEPEARDAVRGLVAARPGEVEGRDLAMRHPPRRRLRPGQL